MRENLRKYGNPDGQQPREDKIAIPSWVVEGKNGLWVLALYGIGLGGGIPFVVGQWWFKQRVLTKDGAISATAENFFHHLVEDISFPALLALVASAAEIKNVLSSKADASSANNSSSKKSKRARQARTEALEEQVKTECEKLGLGDVLTAGWEYGSAGGVASTGGLPGGRSKGVVSPNPFNRRAVALLWAHLLNIQDLDADMQNEKRQVLLQIPKIFPSLINISVAYHWLNTTLTCMNLYAQLVQGCPFIDFPAAQLPGVDLEQAKTLLDKGVFGEGWQKKILQDNAVAESIGSQAVQVAKELPTLTVTEAQFEVEGEPSITVGSLCQFRYTVHLSAEEPSKRLLAASERSEKTQDSSAPVPAKGKIALESTVTKPEKEDDNGSATAFAHAPRWPGHRTGHWWVLVADGTTNMVLFPPQKIGNLPYVNGNDSGSKPKGREFKLNFPAPPTPGSTTLEVHFISDTYVGCNVVKPITVSFL